ncbi:hypothetical protein FACS1894106_2470 [Spirochaetia bacterium]|nr:hypothetical protein FACS1894106_2470 [Spirochaetia bacterium]
MIPRMKNIVFDCEERPMAVMSSKDNGDGSVQMTVKYLPDSVDCRLANIRHRAEMKVERFLVLDGYILIGWRYVRGRNMVHRDVEAYYIKKQGPCRVYFWRYTVRVICVGYGTEHEHEEPVYEKQGRRIFLSKSEVLAKAQEINGENHYINYFKPCDTFYLLLDSPVMLLAGQEKEAVHG